MAIHVLLVNPNRLRPAVAPVGLDYVADCLSDAGITPALCDLCLAGDPEKELLAALAEREYDLIAVSIRNTDDCFLASSVDFLPGFADLIARIRRYSSAPIVVGGSGFSIAPEPALVALGADFGLIGDGERALPLLARSLAARQDVSFIPGLVWGEAGRVNKNAPAYEPIDAFPRRRRFLDNRRYFAEGGQAGIETKRGCDRACIYCADPLGKGRRVRPRRPQQVADEFALLVDQGIDYFHLCDSEFNVPVSHALAVCEALEHRGLSDQIHWYTYAAAAGFTPELAQAMSRAGCVGVNFGADSADDGMLARLGRDYRAADLEAAARACRQAELLFMFDLLLGGPGETKASLARTIDAMKRMSPHRVGVSLGVRIYPGTALSRLVRRQGPLAFNANARGAKEDESLLRPVFYLSSELGEGAADYVGSLVADDESFLFPTSDTGAKNYNYRDNQRLVDAIRAGHRGAYWDILRRLGQG